MKVLLTNDDGIGAPGIQALENACDGDVYIAAPEGQRSECGHQVTTRSAIEVEPYNDRKVAVEGTPADCVRLALRGRLFGEVTFDWVLSGINQGGNLGVDAYISGTVAAAREAAILGVRAIAFSHYCRRDLAIHWPWASEQAAEVFEAIQRRSAASAIYWNVNLPHLDSSAAKPTLAFCDLSRKPLPIVYQSDSPRTYQYAGVYAEREGEPGSDVARCFGGDISITAISL